MESNASRFAGRNEGVESENRSLSASGDEDGDGGGVGGRADRSIAERRAVKCGFNLGCARLNMARLRTGLMGIGTGLDAPPAVLQESPTCITIPAGISPTALLDSPVMLPNSQVELPPTTGTFSVASFVDEALAVHSATTNDGEDGVHSSIGFILKHAGYPSPNSVFSALETRQGTDIDKNGCAAQNANAQFNFPPEIAQNGVEKTCSLDSPLGMEILSTMTLKAGCGDSILCGSDGSGGEMILGKESNDQEDNAHLEDAVEGDNKETYPPSAGASRTAEDGYNWRKYGQKQVKGSEFPRSYYKCTHPGCPVKKKVERSLDGQITEIIYKCAHNHPKPQPARRGVLPSASSMNEMSEIGEGIETAMKVENESQTWRNCLIGLKDIKLLGPDGRNTGLEKTSPTSMITDLSDTIGTGVPEKFNGLIDSAQTPELSSTMASRDDDDEGGATQGSLSQGEDADDEEPESKRRKSENSLVEATLSSRAIREPRVMIQIESEIDILDDGYRWRKYGQKVVKGNPNPRSYYKCTSAGCCVRKHVERASNNLKCVITTYEGKHNHEIPAARNSGHVTSSTGNLGTGSMTGQANLSIPRNPNTPKPEAQIHDMALLDRKPELANEFLRSSLLANFGNDMSCGAPSMFPVKYPPLQNAIPCSSYGLHPSQNALHAPGSMANLVPDFPITMPFRYQQLGKVRMTGLEFHHGGKAVTAGAYQSSIPGQYIKEDMRYIIPKQEKDDNLFETRIPIVDPSAAPSSSMFWPLMGGYPS